MKFEDIFRPVDDVPTHQWGEARVVGALNVLASSGQTRVEVIDLLGMSPKTWGEKCRGRGWTWTQKKEPDSRDANGHLVIGDKHYYIVIH